MLAFPNELGTNDSISQYSLSTVVWKHLNCMWPEFKMPNSRFLSINVSYYCGAAEVGVFSKSSGTKCPARVNTWRGERWLDACEPDWGRVKLQESKKGGEKDMYCKGVKCSWKDTVGEIWDISEVGENGWIVKSVNSKKGKKREAVAKVVVFPL